MDSEEEKHTSSVEPVQELGQRFLVVFAAPASRHVSSIRIASESQNQTLARFPRAGPSGLVQEMNRTVFRH